MRLVYVFTVLLLSFCHLFCVAQDQNKTATMSGKVLDKKGNAIPFAYVVADTLNIGTMCAEDGSFTLKKIPTGKRTITAHTMGYLTQNQAIYFKSNDKQFFTFQLNEDVEQLEEIVLKGKTESLEIRESGFAVNTIQTKAVEQQSIQANELLDRSAGVRIRQNGGLGSNIQYNINGLSGNSIRIFIDGIPIASYGPSFSLNSIPTSMIERIDVYKGVVPAHLSDDALGGAINVVLKKTIQNMLTASYSFGSFNTHQANINGGYRNKKNGFTARASTFYNYSDNSYKVWGDKIYVTDEDSRVHKITAKRFHDNYRSVGGKLDIGFTNVKWADHFFIGTVLSDMSQQIQHGATMEIVYGNRRATQSTQQYSLQYAKQNLFLKGLDLSVLASYSNLNRKVIDTIPYMFTWKGEQLKYKWSSGAEGSSPTLQTNMDKNKAVRANLSYRVLPNHKVNLNYMITGFDRDQDDAMLSRVERDLIDTKNLTKSVLSGAFESQFLKQRLKSSVFFKYYSQSVKLNDRTKDRSGKITELHIDKQTALSGYGIALSYAVLPKLMLIASMEKAMRLPNETEVFGNNVENIDPSYDLKPEQSQNINLGFNLGALKWRKNDISLNTNFFYRNTSDMIRQGIPTQVSETYRFENLLSVLSKGVDVELLYNYNEKAFLTTGFSVFNARFNTEFDEYGARYAYYQNRLRNSPFFTANANLRYQLNHILQKDSKTMLYYNLGYVHEFFRDWEGYGKNNKPTIPTQIVHDLGLAYTLPNKKMTLGFDVKNIFNRQVFDNWALQKPGRAFYIKISYQLI
jgi:outer membrane receptor protein involved in Fe transport